MSPSRSRHHDTATRTRSDGFTLIEMLIALTVLGIAMIGGFEAMRVQHAKRTLEQTQATMQEIQQALLGFVTVNGRLPCAAVVQANPTGLEDCVTSPTDGLLPWVDLALKPKDAWGHYYRYAVTDAFRAAFATAAGAPLGDLAVCLASDTVNIAACQAAATTVADLLPVLVLSYGPNGQADARVNATKYRTGTDDLLLWIPTDVLKYQIIRSATLP